MIETKPKKLAERALLIGLEQDGVSKWDLRDSMEELRELANSAGAGDQRVGAKPGSNVGNF
jgi:hypothetical protein